MNTIISSNLPKVGDRLMKNMSGAQLKNNTKIEPEPCIVVYVHKNHGYYTVRFLDSGLLESYKLFGIDEIAEFKENYARAFGRKPKGIYVRESGVLYKTIPECAKAIGVSHSALAKHLNGDTSHVKGYHVYQF